MTVFAPSSFQELKVMLREAFELEGPAVVRFPKGAARHVEPDDVGRGLSARQVREGADVCLLGVGKMVEAAEEAAGKLEAEGIAAAVWDVRVVKPLDSVMLAAAAKYRLVVTIEDGIRVGGAGSAVADALALRTPGQAAPPVLVLGTPVEYIAQGEPGQIHASLGLDGPGIAASVLEALSSAPVVDLT
jgi:1-deoxy-D-xylulose-5-phosphate synthase